MSYGEEGHSRTSIDGCLLTPLSSPQQWVKWKGLYVWDDDNDYSNNILVGIREGHGVPLVHIGTFIGSTKQQDD